MESMTVKELRKHLKSYDGNNQVELTYIDHDNEDLYTANVVKDMFGISAIKTDGKEGLDYVVTINCSSIRDKQVYQEAKENQKSEVYDECKAFLESMGEKLPVEEISHRFQVGDKVIYSGEYWEVKNAYSSGMCDLMGRGIVKLQVPQGDLKNALVKKSSSEEMESVYVVIDVEHEKFKVAHNDCTLPQAKRFIEGQGGQGYYRIIKTY